MAAPTTPPPDLLLDRPSSSSSPVQIPFSSNPVNQTSLIKLTDSNYLIWKAQILHLIRANGLESLLDGSWQPSPTLPTDSSSGSAPTANPEFTQWSRLNSTVISWIFSSVSETMLGQLLEFTTAHGIWTALSNLFASTSVARLSELRTTLHGLRKDGMPMMTYIQKLKELYNTLASIGEPVSYTDQVFHLLHGLNSEYTPYVTSVQMRTDRPSLETLHSLLLTFDARLDRLSSAGTVSDLQVNLSSLSFSQNRNRPAYPNLSRPPILPSPPRPPAIHSPNYRRPFSTPFSFPKTRCQICHKLGHSALSCYHLRNHQNPSAAAPSHRFSNPRHQPFHRPSYTSHRPAYHTSTHSTSTPDSSWFLDSGASSHFASDPTILDSSSTYSGDDRVLIGNGKLLPISHIGRSVITPIQSPVFLNDVCCSPHLSKNLLSVHRLCMDNNAYVIFTARSFLVKQQGSNQTILRGTLDNGLYRATPQFPLHQNLHTAARTTPSSIWHLRLGHPSKATLSHLSSVCNFSRNSISEFCISCHMSKSHCLPFSNSISNATSPFNLMHIDLWGPSPVTSLTGARYFLLIVDDFSRFSWIFMLQSKSEAKSTVISFITMISTQFDLPVKRIRSDGGGEFQSLQSFFHSKGIIHELSCPHTPQQNGRVERKNRHVVETGLALLEHSKLPPTFWPYAFQTAVFLINRLPTPTLQLQTPYQKLYSKPPDYSILRTFGCLCFPHLRPYNKHKLQFRSQPCVFLGYSTRHKGYICYHVPSTRLYITRHTIFDETSFPFANPTTLPSSTQPNPPTQFTSIPTPIVHPNLSPPLQQPPPPPQPIPTTTSSSTRPDPPAFHDHSPEDISSNHPSTPQHPTSIPIPAPAPTHPMITRAKAGIFKPKTLLTATLNLTSEPTTFQAACKSSHWIAAMETEYQALRQQGTWSLVPLPPGHRAIGSKWVYRVKLKADGSIDRYKARLVAKGYHQVEGLDFSDTYSPVVKPTTIRLVLSIATSLQWPIRQLDVQNAFLHGDLTETVFMTQPQGFIDPSSPQLVCRLHKSLYGLKQSPRAWYFKLSSALLSLGFLTSKADSSLFILRTNTHTVLILVYVDDIIICGSNQTIISSIISNLSTLFAIKDLGPLHYFLGVEVTKTHQGLHLCQTRYIHDLLTKTGLLDSKPTATPMAVHPLSIHSGTPLTDAASYRQIMGSLQYCTLTRPDIAFAVNRLCQFLHCPTDIHLIAAKRILRYLKGTSNFGLHIQQDSNLHISCYTDADWASCPDDRRSTSGYCAFLGSNLISWSSSKQRVVSRSSTESEYRSMANGTAEICWIISILSELGLRSNQAPTLFCDNISSLHLATNPVLHARTKHIELDQHFVREKVARKELTLAYISSSEQLADCLTKPLPTRHFQDLRNKLFILTRPRV